MSNYSNSSNIIAIDPGFVGAGRVLKELSKISSVKYIQQGEEVSYDDDLLFLPAWQPGYYPELIRRYKKVVVCWTSPILQSEFVPVEIDYLKQIIHLLDSGKIHALWVGCESWLPFLKKGGRKVFYCPYPVTLPEKPVLKTRNSPPRDVSLFGPLHPRKNVIAQAIAASNAQCVIHITDNSAAQMLHKLDAKFVAHGWLAEKEYFQLVSRMDLGLQVSVPGVESMSYVFWDHLSLDVPCLTTVDWAPWMLRVNVPNDPAYIQSRMCHGLGLKEFCSPGTLRKWAEEFAKKRNTDVLDILKTELIL